MLLFAMRFVRDRDAAEDIVARAVLNALRGIDSFAWESGRPMRQWLNRIVYNAFLDHLRERSRRPVTVSSDCSIDVSHDGSGLSVMLDTEDAGPSPEQALLDTEEMDGLRAALKKAVAPIDRQVLHLQIDEGMAADDIAAALGVPVGTVRSRLSRAKARLQKILVLDCQKA